jgi:hypothetical protein
VRAPAPSAAASASADAAPPAEPAPAAGAAPAARAAPAVHGGVRAAGHPPAPRGPHPLVMGLHSSAFRLNVSTFCGIRWLHDFPPVY